MKISTILYENGIKNYIDSETIGKLILCYYRNIHDNLSKLNDLQKKDDLYLNELFNTKSESEKINIKSKYKLNEKKFNIIKTLFDSSNYKEFCYIENYIFPENINNLCGPFIHDKYIMFYNPDSEILIVFTFTPLNYSIKRKEDYKNDIKVRDLNCYIIDNLSKEKFAECIESQVSGTLDYINILSFNSISIKICDHINSKNKKIIELLRIVKEEIKHIKTNNTLKHPLKHPFYKWEITEKGKFINKETENEQIRIITRN